MAATLPNQVGLNIAGLKMSHDCRRQETRFPTDTLVWWQRGLEAEPLALLDISAHGMLCEFPQPFAVGEEVMLEIEFPGETHMVTCTATVAHAREEGVGGQYLVGLRILSIEGMDQETFAAKLEQVAA